MPRKWILSVLLAISLLFLLWDKLGDRGKSSLEDLSMVDKPAGSAPLQEPAVKEPEMIVVKPLKVQEKPSLKKPKPPRKKPIPETPLVPPPPVELHEELIPRNIDIVRFYYSQPITGPQSRIGFDINGSGFTKEFEKMISVESGDPHVEVSDFRLVTPNQIHGDFVVAEKTATSVIFPTVLIQKKVVFQAPEPFGVIRPDDAYNSP